MALRAAQGIVVDLTHTWICGSCTEQGHRQPILRQRSHTAAPARKPKRSMAKAPGRASHCARLAAVVGFADEAAYLMDGAD
jgi:hypothetical protein